MMRFSKKALFALILGGLTIAASSCNSASDTAPQNQTVAVTRGNLTIDITGVGNLALSQKDDLAFEIAGTVAEVLVEEGDTVEKGQVLAKLDTSEWETQLSALEDKVTAAERFLTAKKRAVTTAERQVATKKDAVTTAERQLATKKDAVTAAERQVATKKDAVITAERQLVTKKDAVITAERQLVTKKDAVTAAERQLATKKDAVTVAERQLVAKKRNVTAKERDVLQAEINLKDAQTVLDTTQVTYTVADYTEAQAAVAAAKTELETAQQKLSRYAPGSEDYWIFYDLLISAQSKLDSAQAELDDMLSGFKDELAKNQRLVETAQWNLETAQIAVEDAQIAVGDAQKGIEAAQFAVEDAQKGIETAQFAVEDAQKAIETAQIAVADAQKGIEDAQIAVADAQKGIETAQLAVADAQKGIETAQLAVEDAQLGIEDAQLAVKDAQKALDDAQKALDEAQSDHPEIVAPSAGFITKVNVIGGDEVKKGTVAVTLADPNKFEADILVNETDILQTKLGGNASVLVEAMPGMNLPAKVTHISPTAVIQQGIVNYKVKVEIESLQSVMQARQQAMGNIASGNVTAPGRPTGGSLFSGNVTSGVFPDRMRQGIEGGGFTQEQIEEMRRQRQQGQEAPSALPAMISSDFQLREGQTVTVSILVAERNDVLLVPNGAITRQGRQSMVKVMKDGVIEERPVTVGISNWQYTEVTDGLTEGESVIVSQSTAPTPSASQQNQGGMRIAPGMGGFGR